MGIFDIFSNSDAQNAAAAQAAGYTAGYNQLTPLLQQGTGALQQNYGYGQNALNTQAQNAIQQGLVPNFAAAQGQLAGAYGQGANALNQNYAAALQPFQQNYGATSAGQAQLGNLLGLGPQGGAGIQNALQNLPGYQFALNQGTQNVLRNQAATGQLNSGATNMDLNNYAQGQAQQAYNNYVSQLQPYLGAAGNAAAGIAGVNTGLGGQLAGLYQGLGQGQAGLSTGFGNQLANTYTGLGQNLNQSYQGLGQGINQNLNTQGAAAYGTQAAIGNAQAQADYANLAQSGALFGGLTSLAGNALGAYIKSDARGKKHLRKSFKQSNGATVYKYWNEYTGQWEIGLIAQDVEKVRPEAVWTDLDGTKRVNYLRATR